MSATSIPTHIEEIPNESSGIGLERIAPAAGLIGFIFTAISVISMITGGTQAALGSYLFGWFFWMSLTLGFLGIGLLYYTLRASWALPLIRLCEAGGSWVSFVTMAVLFAPILVGLPQLYKWANPTLLATDSVLMHKAPYLNVPFMLIRFVLYFVLWGGCAFGMRRSALKQDENGDGRLEGNRSSAGAFGLLVFVISITFAFTDWVMSLDPHWTSTIFGVWLVVGAGLATLSFGALNLCLNKDKEPYKSIITPNLTRDIGNMMFVFTMLWGYTSLSQFLIIWNGNMPDTAAYYRTRSEFGWNVIGMILIFGQFLLPFMWLLAPRAKRVPSLLAKIAGWIFVMHILDTYMVVVPSLPVSLGSEHGRVPGQSLLLDVVSFIGVGGIWFYVFAKQVGKAALLPKYDTRLQEAAKHAH